MRAMWCKQCATTRGEELGDLDDPVTTDRGASFLRQRAPTPSRRGDHVIVIAFRAGARIAMSRFIMGSTGRATASLVPRVRSPRCSQPAGCPTCRVSVTTSSYPTPIPRDGRRPDRTGRRPDGARRRPDGARRRAADDCDRTSRSIQAPRRSSTASTTIATARPTSRRSAPPVALRSPASPPPSPRSRPTRPCWSAPARTTSG